MVGRHEDHAAPPTPTAAATVPAAVPVPIQCLHPSGASSSPTSTDRDFSAGPHPIRPATTSSTTANNTRKAAASYQGGTTTNPETTPSSTA